uniref:Uncharacterized protein n=1 Tax=Cucumis sativus TaxID=3659 RepID=A0A0A0KXN3_CUCSA
MDQIMNKVGSYWFNQKASKEIGSIGDDINSLSTSIQGGTSWLVNKIKVQWRHAITMYWPRDIILVSLLQKIVHYFDSSSLVFRRKNAKTFARPAEGL